MDTAEIQVVEEQHLAASNVPTVEEQYSEAPSKERSHWTSSDDTSWPEQDSVRVIPRNKVRKFKRTQIELLEKINQGGQEIQVVEEQLHLAASTSMAQEQYSKASSAGISHWSSDWNSDWTSIDSTPRSEPENVRVFPGNKVRKFKSNQIQLLDKIAEGAQGCIYNAKLSFPIPVAVDSKNNFTYIDSATWDRRVFVAKIFKGKAIDNHFGQWPEELFEIHELCRYVCFFYGYSIYNPVDDNPDGDSFCLLMEKYDCSLRDSIDEHMKKGMYKGRPFHGPVALCLIIQIALGMAFLEQLDIIHGDLKAANILVLIGEHDRIPEGVFIADFDVASTMQGTLFWRAPEILQALKYRDNRFEVNLPFTSKSDVYSFGMVCYEILTGDIPFKGSRYTDYDMVLSGKRPKLPSNVNRKMKNLLARCWQHDPHARPTFKEIVSELQGFVAGTPVYMQLFTQRFASDDVIESDYESNLVKLKHYTHVLAEKYKQGSSALSDTIGDFVVVSLEYVDLLEEFKSKFGLESFKEHPSLPCLESLSRNLLKIKIIYKGNMFLATCPQVIPEFFPISMLMHSFLSTMVEVASQSMSNSSDDYKSLSEEDKSVLLQGHVAVNEESQRYSQTSYANRHEACHKILIDLNHGIVNDTNQPCIICRDLSFYAPKTPQVGTFYLYEDRWDAFKSLFTLLAGNFRNFIFSLLRKDM